MALSHILVPVDGSENAANAAKFGIELAKKYNATLKLLHVISTPSYLFAEASMVNGSVLDSYYTAARKESKKLVDDLVSLGESEGVNATGVVLEDAPSAVQVIVDYAKQEKVDLIIIGTRGLSGFKKTLMGSVSSGVLNHAHCSVLVVK